MNRFVAWFSCGAASAVASKLALEKFKDVDVVYCDTSENEHPDNHRFFYEVQEWLGKPITVLRSKRYRTIEEVFDATKYMSGPSGARCTVELKKLPRFEYEHPLDTHIFGFTVDELKRISRFEQNNRELKLRWLLVEEGYTKKDCLDLLTSSGINLPKMYQLGYKNNNCIGCVKASSTKYWNMIRKDFPDIFKKRAEQSREIGCRLTRLKGERIFLDELPLAEDDGEIENISCGPECQGEQK